MDMSVRSFAPGAETGRGLPGLERKFVQFDEVAEVTGGVEIKGYASFFDAVDQGNDVVQRGAYGASLMALKAAGRGVKMLWQHDPAQPIGVWDEVREDNRGTVKASKNTKGQRLLQELELWEVSLVTFPMLPSARVGAKADGLVRLGDVLRDMAGVFDAASADIASRPINQKGMPR